MRVAVLSDNTTVKPDIMAEHGLSLLVEKNGAQVLVDTGASDLFLRNAEKLDISLRSLNMIFLSHGHYDHTGGLVSIMEKTDAHAYAHPDLFMKRYVRKKKENVGFPHAQSRLERGILDRVHLGAVPRSILGFHTTGEIPRTIAFEEPYPHFYRDAERKKLDIIPDDQALYTSTSKGLVVFLGCTHAGLINTLQYIIEISGEKKIHWIIGGTHLMNATERRLRETAEAMSGFDIDYISPLHCTGFKGLFFFLTRFKDKCRPLGCGDVITIEC
jgi:7,8-dihydropterin-6-yl-methyl-4-(beta-D-ribofuranosyl)aminobenzene 5'-phosphate synthase